MFKRNKIKPTLPDNILQEYYAQYGKDKVFCRAPFNNLYFLPNGDVTPCCVNRLSYKYATYPPQSIKKIIASKKRKKHQKYIKNNNLSLGCDVCQNNMMSKNFASVLATAFKWQSLKKHITHIDFELSHNCNLKCVMCYRERNSDNKSIYGESFFNELKPYLKNLEFAHFVGGEPFMIDVYYKIWDYISKKNPNCHINIQTNGTILNDKITQFISLPKVSVVMSIDSVSPHTFETIRKGAKFENVLSNFKTINKIMQDKGINMQISVCPITLNANEIPELVDFANKEQCTIFFNYTFFPYYLSLKNLAHPKLQALTQLYKTHLENLTQNNNIEKNNANALLGLINQLKEWEKEALDKERNKTIIKKEEVVKIVSHIEVATPNIQNIFFSQLEDSWEISTVTYNSLNEKAFIEEVNFTVMAFKNGYFEEKNIIEYLKFIFEVR